MPDVNSLDDQIRYVKGVGPRRAEILARLGVQSVADLLEYFPFRHELIPKSQPIGSLSLDMTATVLGELRLPRRRGGRGKAIITASVVDGTGECRLRWFNSPFILEKLKPGLVVRATGKVELDRKLARLTNPRLVFADPNEPFAGDEDRFIPVYPATAELPSRQIARAVEVVLNLALDAVEEFLPESIVQRRELLDRRSAIRTYHRPRNHEDVAIARRRLAYEELLLCQLAVQLVRKAHAASARAHPFSITEEIDQRIRARFPFPLTPGQDEAVRQINQDLVRTQPMNRLLQGDVGAGKTAVAVYAALAAIANRQQVVILAPTEVLAQQHYEKVDGYLAGSRVRIGFLSGSTPRRDRPALLKQLADGAIDLLVGTHAVLEDDVRFRDLGLVIIDEQHKFGVAQRAALRAKANGGMPHTLVLSATPIPRTLALTAFGELDISTIDDRPAGRGKIVTRLLDAARQKEAWDWARRRIEKGEQAYVVCPMIEETEEGDLRAAAAEAARLQKNEFKNHRVGLLHGRMKPNEKADVMAAFRHGDLNVLVSTTVVEVGVDVPNATVMIIEHAERYGLSQLHQLRGRIGRSEKPSWCVLLSSPKAEESIARLQILCDSNDGFHIAEEDLRLRGPGELLGKRQHGIPSFKVADLAQDMDLIEMAREDTGHLLQRDPALESARHRSLRKAIERRFGDTLAFINVG